MQFSKVLVIFIALFYQSLAFSISNGKINFPGSGKSAISIDKFDTKINSKGLSHKVTVKDLEEIIEFGFSIPSNSDNAIKSHLLLGFPRDGLETVIEPLVQKKDDKLVYLFNIRLNALSKALLSRAVENQESLEATLLLANEDNKNNNIFGRVFQLTLSPDLEVQYTKPSRFGFKDEIHHIFRSPPKAAPAFIAQVFSLAIAGCVVLLIGTWLSTGVLSNMCIPGGMNSIYFIVMISSIVGFEYIFTNYYLGVSIFETLHAGLYLIIPSLIIGTKFLRNIGKQI
ncbi:hypothetical protein Kpol_1043p3 [Vanderwaltozyma polyspora DSM 70294]|uniref:Ribophorin II C-terminal domain-containing protein n=1 Tax=Vanderwaltozyma polyspora (strain ATCC 22028 / DSM 70294 / BCRC 21397 / CBS 2163 / NBRC 10782 / NRRL Y-8283 / UCD 57-17) TaxID=436907 RepID=A7TIM1_VANPO|nr:uncharacterized protein Kpol_1043p3 [Vanderwaltozyma polyspora DSM 70294]EDO17813.1 hypothetical protein Kpol_1043p3 [Vanderwaltozyma polyspora DSM 70294]